MTTLTGKFIYEDNTPVANGILVLTLSQPCIISGTAQIVPLVKVIQLDATGSIPGATSVYGNDALTPSGTTYTACLYTGVLDNATGLYNTGAQLFSLAWSITGASVDVSTLTPTSNGASYVSPVTSIGLTMPGEFSVSGSPVSSAGTFVVSKVVQSANQVYAGPTSGGAAAPGFRALVDADIPVTLNNHQMTGTDNGTETLTNKTLDAASNVLKNLLRSTAQAQATGNVSLTAGVVATVLSVNVTMPSSGGPFRVLISWNMNIGNGASNATIVGFVTDGTNNFCGVDTALSASFAGGSSMTAISPVTYANGAVLTFTLKAVSNAAGTINQASQQNANGGQKTQITVSVIPAA